jgi:hypothetical protein
VVPGGVDDAAGHTAFVQGPRGGIDAVDVASGRILWADAAPQRPLALAGDRLLVEVQTNADVRLAVRPAHAGARPLAVSDPLPFPSWLARAGARGRRFESAAEPIGRERVRYRWSARAEPTGGMHPAQSEEAPAPRVVAGELTVDLATAKWTVASPPAPPFASRPYRDDGAVRETAWLVDGDWCALAPESRGGVDGLALRCATSDGKPQPPRWLGASGPELPRRSLDGAVMAIASPASARAQLIEVPSGKRLGEVPAAELAGAFGVAGAILFTEVPASRDAARPRALRALDYATGATRWSHALYTPPSLPPLPSPSPPRAR